MFMVPLEGPVGVGALIDAILLGCAIVQSAVYFMKSKRDVWFFKVLVSLILFLLVFHLVCMAIWLWVSAQTSTGNVPNYTAMLFGVSTMLAATISFFERFFFSRCILKVSNNPLLGFVFFTCCIFSFTAAIGAACTFFTGGTVNLTDQLRSSWIFPLVLIFGLVCDLAISAVTAFYLGSQIRSEEVDALGRVTRLFLLLAETSTLTSLFDVVAVVVYWLTKSNFAWVSLLVVMPGVFANALLVALNVRGRLCIEIEHQRVLEIGEKLIDKDPKRPPIMISISQRVDKCTEGSAA